MKRENRKGNAVGRHSRSLCLKRQPRIAAFIAATSKKLTYALKSTVTSCCKDTWCKDIFIVRTMQLETNHCVLTAEAFVWMRQREEDFVGNRSSRYKKKSLYLVEEEDVAVGKDLQSGALLLLLLLTRNILL